MLIALFLLGGRSIAQEKTVQGIVFDTDSKQRLSRVYIYNTTTSKGFYNNSKGEFTTVASPGDILVAALQGYRVDTLSVGTSNTLLFYLKQTSIRLKEVRIQDSLINPTEQLKETQKAYKGAYTKGNTKDIFSTGGSNSAGGAGLSINTLYNLLSKEGKNARQLQKIIERDYREAMIAYRYNPVLVTDVTGLKGDKLTDFMEQYRPSYSFVIEASDYQLITFIKTSYQRYLQNPAAHRLEPLEGNRP
ncbi:carboxypeptidase-like regulatory domain-containing protein [Flavihumibacter sp. R14]|nr:carboxypeptidase-like regulatory domain-containing protein [Flavihumibacter soli]